ncbi:MAG: HAD-IA family hydrolase [Chloroflexota bacterium]|nr:HAD-IA family hydrolase [Chloroflexota bacterium]MDE3101844.1 HAD-IA family hydrolase [Chloroflexota bacterium]
MSSARRVRGVLWDLDGTLTDSVRLVVDTANRVIGAHGGTALDADVVGRMTGAPLEQIFRIAWPDLTPTEASAYRDEYRLLYERDAIPATRLHRGARATLRAFHEAGLRQATVTGKRAADCERILRGLRIRGEIDAYLGGDSVARPKPAPDLALAAAARIGLPPEECVVVGDAPADVEMAHSAGARVIQVAWGYAGAKLEGADAFVRTWPALRRAVFGPPGDPAAGT